MSHFCIYSYDSKIKPYVLNVQSHFLDNLETRIVIPLISSKDYVSGVKRLEPAIKIKQKTFILLTHEIAAVPTNIFGETIKTLNYEEQLLVSNALDFLFHGF